MLPVKPRLVPCPRCGVASAYDTSNAYRPFCSRRCKLIDLGQWADEAYRVPSTDAPTEDDLPSESQE